MIKSNQIYTLLPGAKISRFSILVLIFCLHCLIFVLYAQKKSPQITAHNTTRFLQVTSFTTHTANLDTSTTQTKEKTQNKLSNIVPRKTVKIILPITAPIKVDNIQVQEGENKAIEPKEKTLVFDIKAITQEMKKDFLKRDQPPSLAKQDINIFGNRVSSAAIVNRESTKIQSKHMYDGRPVSKVITPFGTYCIRHPKAGEKLELTPPPLPVGCGRL